MNSECVDLIYADPPIDREAQPARCRMRRGPAPMRTIPSTVSAPSRGDSSRMLLAPRYRLILDTAPYLYTSALEGSGRRLIPPPLGDADLRPPKMKENDKRATKE